MNYLLFKSLHIIFMVSYFAGIFYLVRLFVYYQEANFKPQMEKEILQKQYLYMIKRLWNIITVPAGILMTIFGLMMLYLNTSTLVQSWFHIKLFFLVVLGVFHFWSWKSIQSIKLNKPVGSSIHLRMMNEVATFILFAVVFVVILKGLTIEIGKELLFGFFLLIILIMIIVKSINKLNKK